MAPALPDFRPAARRTRLLVVEDELATICALRTYFALAGFEVDCAASPAEALLLLGRNPYEAVITDLHLTPGRRGEGLDVAAEARRRNPGACIVLLTAYGSEVTEREAQQRGVDVYQTKPVRLPRLTAYIEHVLNGHSAAKGAPIETGRRAASLPPGD